MAKQKNVIRSCYYSLVSYIPSLVEVLSIIHSMNVIKAYAVIEHNKDKNSITCTDKVSHIHIGLILRTNVPIHQVRAWFEIPDTNGQPINCLAQVTHSNSALIDYFIHKNEPEKYQYSIDDIISNDLNAFKADVKEDNTLNIIEDLIAKKSTRSMVSIYGRDFVINYKSYVTVARLIHYEDVIEKDKLSIDKLEQMTEEKDLLSEIQLEMIFNP